MKLEAFQENYFDLCLNGYYRQQSRSNLSQMSHDDGDKKQYSKEKEFDLFKIRLEGPINI